VTGCVAIIPARAGSKRIPGKNTRDFCGQPLISYSIVAAKNSGLFDQIIVSTDCEKVAAVARRYGAETPFVRPAKLADDHCGIGEVIDHAIDALIGLDQKPDYVCCIFATAPLLRPDDLERGLREIECDTRFSSSLAVTTFDFPVQRALRVDQSMGLSMISPEYQMTRSQDLEETYHDAGQFFWIRLSNRHDPNAGQKAILIERMRVQDIDTPEDWDMAECQFRAVHMYEASQERESSS